MNAMRKEEIARDMDPEKLKVYFLNVRFYHVVNQSLF